MSRKYNTDTNGSDWTEITKLEIWYKAQPIPGRPSNLWRRDCCGFAIRYTDFGDRDSMYGWEIDHIYPVAKGGNDNPRNLQPLNWKNNAKKGDSLTWYCPK